MHMQNHSVQPISLLAPQNAKQDSVARTVNLFNFEGFDVRVVLIDGEPWFSARDVAEGLGYSNPRKQCATTAKARARWGERFVHPWPIGKHYS